MTKLNLSLAILLIGTAVVAGNTTGCSSKSGGTGAAGATGTAGSTGAAGATGGSTAGSTGTGGTPSTCTMNTATLTTSPCKCVPGAYVRMGACACQEGMPDICPTVGCVDKMHDVANCGTCGMACGATSTCNGGTCGAAPTMVAAAPANCTAMSIVATTGGVFYAANNSIGKAGVATPIATGEMGASMLASSGANLYWYNTGNHKIRTVPAAGGTPTDVYTAMPFDGGMPEVLGFLVDGTNIYFSLGNNVYKKPITPATATPTVVVEEVHEGIPAALALNGTTNIVLPATFNGDVDAPLLSANPAICGMEDPNDPGNAVMTTCPRLGRSQGELFPNFIAVVAGHAYWVDGPNLKGELIGTKGTSFDSISMAATSKITAAVSNGVDAIYFADADPNDAANGFIEKSALTPNSTPTLLARGQKSPLSIAVDATKVYWASSDCSTWSQNR